MTFLSFVHRTESVDDGDKCIGDRHSSVRSLCTNFVIFFLCVQNLITALIIVGQEAQLSRKDRSTRPATVDVLQDFEKGRTENGVGAKPP